MRYKFISRCKVMPVDTQLFVNGRWRPYYNKVHRWSGTPEKNYLFGPKELRLPLSTKEARKPASNKRVSASRKKTRPA